MEREIRACIMEVPLTFIARGDLVHYFRQGSKTSALPLSLIEVCREDGDDRPLEPGTEAVVLMPRWLAEMRGIDLTEADRQLRELPEQRPRETPGHRGVGG